ncbi:MAG: hypothetical protein K2Y32_23065 [Candidatus Obscuribacterales bacterium]|nr:hypothetical protein [Candidatus Obscuribacterales bacterium]
MSGKKENDKPDHEVNAQEKALESPDAQGVRHSTKAEISSVESTRTNQSDGSLRHFSRPDLSGQDQSIELTYQGKTSSRTNKLTEVELLREQAKSALEAQSETIEEMREVVKTTPALAPVLALREHAQALPPGEDKDKYRDLALSQAKELSPEMAAYLSRRDDNSSAAGQEELLSGKVTENHFAGDLRQAAAELGRMPLDNQIAVLTAGFMAGYEQYQHDEREKSWGRLIGCVEGLGSAFTSIATVVDFGGAILWNDKKIAGDIAEKFGNDLAIVTFEGIRLFAAADKCLYDTGASGDYSLPFRQIAAVGVALNERWNEVPPREQERIKYRLITEMAADGLIGAAGAKALGNAKSFTGLLDAAAVEAGTQGKQVLAAAKGVGKQVEADLKGMTQDVKAAGKNALRYMGEVVDALTAQEMAMASGGKLKFSKGFGRQPHFQDPRDFVYAMSDGSAGNVYRGDHDVYSRFNIKGRPKSCINENGDLSPASPEGIYKGKKVTVEEHLAAKWCRGAKAHSPYTSFGHKDGVLKTFGKGDGLTLDLDGLRAAIASGEVRNVKVFEHEDVLKAIEGSRFHIIIKNKLLTWAKAHHEVVVEGIIPGKFLKIGLK